MKEIINSYKRHKVTVDNFISSLMKSLPKDYINQADTILNQYRYIQLMYGVDEHYHQTTPIVCRKERDTQQIGSDKGHYFIKMQLDEEGMYISNPYIHYRTGKASISVVRRMEGTLYVFDINLILILEELKLIEYNSTHDKFKRAVYFVGSSLLALVALTLIGYGGYVLVILLLSLGSHDFIHEIFKSIIAITLGLAIYDLAKQIFEHEVIFYSFL